MPHQQPPSPEIRDVSIALFPWQRGSLKVRAPHGTESDEELRDLPAQLLAATLHATHSLVPLRAVPWCVLFFCIRLLALDTWMMRNELRTDLPHLRFLSCVAPQFMAKTVVWCHLHLLLVLRLGSRTSWAMHADPGAESTSCFHCLAGG